MAISKLQVDSIINTLSVTFVKRYMSQCQNSSNFERSERKKNELNKMIFFFFRKVTSCLRKAKRNLNSQSDPYN